MARVWDFSASFEPKTVATAMARIWKLDGWKFTTVHDANNRPVDHCPISLEPMEDPVLVCDGHIYDRNSITQWIAEGNKLSPCVGEDLAHTKLLRIQPFRVAVERFLRQRGSAGTSAEQAAVFNQAEGTDHMQTHAAVAAMVQKKLQQRVERANGKGKPFNKDKSSDRALPAGRFALNALESSVHENEERLAQMQEKVDEGRREMEKLRSSLQEAALLLLQRSLLRQHLQPRREKAATKLQRFFRQQLKLRTWRIRAEKLASHFARALAAGNEELVDRFQSKGDVDYKLVLRFLKEGELNRQLHTGINPLYTAAKAGHTISVRLLLKAGADKEVMAAAGSEESRMHTVKTTPLYSAASCGHIGAVRLLCEARCNINAGPALTPLFHAAESGHMDVVRVLCAARAAVNLTTDTGLVPLHAAAKNGDLEMVLLLFRSRAEPDIATRKPATICASHGKGELEARITPLFLAAGNGFAIVVRALCAQRADAGQALPDSGRTPLYIAARSGHADVVKVLVDEGVSVNIRLNKTGWLTPLLAASTYGHMACVQILCDARADVDVSDRELDSTAVHIASSQGHADVVKLLCKVGANLNKSPASGATAVYMAALNGHTEVVRTLCTAKAVPDTETSSKFGNKTPLFVAAKSGYLEIAKILCLARCDVHRSSSTGATPLHVAAMHGHVEMMERLLKSRSDLTRGTSIGATPLHLASLSNKPEAVRFLCQARADKHASAARTGSTPLMMAVLCGHSDVVDVLCEEDPKRQAKMLKQTALLLHVAARNGHEGIVWRLCKCGANVNEMVTQDALDQLHEATQPPCEDELDAEMSREGMREDEWAEENRGVEEVKIKPDWEAAPRVREPEADEDVPAEVEVEREHPEVSLHVGATPMFMAALLGHFEAVKVLYEAGAQVDKTGAKDGATPFIVAAQQGHLEVAKYLLDLHANVNRRLTDMGATAIYLAAESGQLEIVQFLCKYRADLNQPTSDVPQPPLLAAALHNHYDIVATLCAARANLDQVREDATRDTTLTMASEYGFVQTCRSLLEARANANKATGSGAAPLLLASEHGHESLVKLLCAARADPNQCLTTSRGIAPLPVAVRRGFLPIVEHLLQSQADPNMKCFPAHLSAIMLATESANACLGHTLATMPETHLHSDIGTPVLFVALLHHRIELVSMLLRHRADVNRCADDFSTPLLCAVSTGLTQSVRILCEAAADINFSRAPQVTALQSAAGEGQAEIVEYLCQNRADINLDAHDGTFPLLAAVATDDIDNSPTVVELLLVKAEIDKSTKDGKTPLIAAAEHNQVETARLLLGSRCNINAAKQNGTTALLMAAEVAPQSSNLDMAELLLEHRSSIDRTNFDFGATALHIAASGGHAPLVQLLLQHRAQVNKPSTKGHTPLHFACWWNHPEVVRMLLDARADKHACVGYKPGNNAFLMAVLQDNPAVMKVLCEDQISEQRDIELCSVLVHVAARNGQSKVADCLFELRCDLNRLVRDVDKVDLTWAAQSAQCLHPCNSATTNVEEPEDKDFDGADADDFEEDMLRGWADVDAGYAAMYAVEVDLQVGATPLYLAAFYGHDDLVYSLLCNRADPEISCNHKNPLMAAAEEGNSEVVRVLCESQASQAPLDLDRSDPQGRTALFMAAEEARTDVIYELCRARADVNKGIQGLSPLHMAVSGNCTEMVCMLCASGADIEGVRASLQQMIRERASEEDDNDNSEG